MPPLVYEIFDLFSSLIRLIGMAVFGAAFSWLALDLLKKTTLWQVQVAVFLGLAGLLIAMAVFVAAGSLGAFCLGIGVGIFLWGLPRKKKEEEQRKK